MLTPVWSTVFHKYKLSAMCEIITIIKHGDVYMLKCHSESGVEIDETKPRGLLVQLCPLQWYTEGCRYPSRGGWDENLSDVPQLGAALSLLHQASSSRSQWEIPVTHRACGSSKCSCRWRLLLAGEAEVLSNVPTVLSLKTALHGGHCEADRPGLYICDLWATLQSRSPHTSDKLSWEKQLLELVKDPESPMFHKESFDIQ